MNGALATVLAAAAGWQLSAGRPPDRLAGDRTWVSVRLMLCLIAGAIAALVSRRVIGLLPDAAFALFCAGAIVVALIDLLDYRIPRTVVLRTAAVGGSLLLLAAVVDHDWARAADAAMASAAALAAFLVLHLLAPGGLGFGDVRLASLCGGFLGWMGLGTAARGLALGILLAGLLAAGLLAARFVRRSSYLPFGPFLVVGSLLAIFIS